MNKEKKDYLVGFKKPPAASQFKKGVSGNPKGRPKGSRNFSTIFNCELDSLVPITEHGRPKQARKKEVIVKQVVNKAAGGDLKAIAMLLNESRYAEQQAAQKEVIAPSFSAADKQVLHNFAQRIRNSMPISTTEETPESPAFEDLSQNHFKESTS